MDRPLDDSQIRLIERINHARKCLKKAITDSEKKFFRQELEDCSWVAEQKHSDLDI